MIVYCHFRVSSPFLPYLAHCTPHVIKALELPVELALIPMVISTRGSAVAALRLQCAMCEWD